MFVLGLGSLLPWNMFITATSVSACVPVHACACMCVRACVCVLGGMYAHTYVRTVHVLCQSTTQVNVMRVFEMNVLCLVSRHSTTYLRVILYMQRERESAYPPVFVV